MAAAITTAMATTISSFSSLSLRPSHSLLLPLSLNFSPKPLHHLSITHSSSDSIPNLSSDEEEDIEIESFGTEPYFDEMPPETDEEIAAAYEAIYGPAYSGVSVLGNDPTPKKKKEGPTASGLGRKRREKATDGFEERVVQVRRVTKVVKGGKKMSFRAVVVVGDKQGKVGVGVGKAKEIVDAIVKSAANARRNIIAVPMTKYSTFPHRYTVS